jgi:hypothetical protein
MTLIGWDIFYFIFQKYFIWSHQTCHKSPSGGAEEVLFVFGVIWIPRWSPLASDWSKHFWLIEKLHAMSPDITGIFL